MLPAFWNWLLSSAAKFNHTLSEKVKTTGLAGGLIKP